MKKFVSFVLLLLMTFTFVSALTVCAATETTVFYAFDNVENYDMKLNVKLQSEVDNWKQVDMVLTGYSYNGKKVYMGTYTDLYDGVAVMQFQQYSDGEWKAQNQAFSSWQTASTYNGKIYDGSTFCDYTENIRAYRVIFYNSYPDGLDDGTKSLDVEVKSPFTYEVPVNPTLSGYNFTGWYDGAAKKQTFSAGESVTLTTSVTYYAHWEKNDESSFNVTFVGDSTKTVLCASNSVIAALSLPTELCKDGYNYEFYKDSSFSEKFTVETLTADITIYVKYLQILKVITVDENGNEKTILIDKTDDDSWKDLIADSSPRSYVKDDKTYHYAGTMISDSTTGAAEAIYFLEYTTKSSLRLNVSGSTLDSVDIRFGAYVQKAEYSKLFSNIDDLNLTFGVRLTINGNETLFDCTNIGLIDDTYYQYAALITGISPDMYNLNITAQCYIKDSDGDIIYNCPQSVTYSVKSLAQKYLDTQEANLTDTQKEWLYAIIGA